MVEGCNVGSLSRKSGAAPQEPRFSKPCSKVGLSRKSGAAPQEHQGRPLFSGQGLSRKSGAAPNGRDLLGEPFPTQNFELRVDVHDNSGTIIDTRTVDFTIAQ